jgi:hypothetical protein
MTANKEIYINGTDAGIANRFKAQVIERRPGHPDFGKVVFETPLAPNLILENGMNAIPTTFICDLFLFACIGTSSTPTEVTSGSITATTSGTACTASTSFFNSGMVGQLIYFPSTGQSATITVYTDTTHVTLSATLSISSGLLFDIFAINQTGLGGEVHRTGTYLTGSGNCGTTYSAGVYTHQRTYDFPIETSDQTYYEVGFSNSSTSGANLNMRGILSSAPVNVVIGQQVRLIYYVLVTVTPISPRARSVSISGWPALPYNVAFASGTPGVVTLVGYGFPLNTQVFFEGTVNPGGVTFGSVYYVLPIDANTFNISASSSGSPVNVTSDGTDVILYTNTNGNEQLAGGQFTSINTDGTTNDHPSGIAGPVGEPSAAKLCTISTDNVAIAPYGSTQGSPVIPTGGQQSLVQGSYSSSSYLLTWSVTYTVDQGNSSSIYKLLTQDSSGLQGLIYLFEEPQQKTNLYTLTITWQYTWGRIFI